MKRTKAVICFKDICWRRHEGMDTKMIQDIFPRRLNNQYMKDAVPENEDKVLCIRNGEIVVSREAFEKNIVAFPRVKDYENVRNFIYLFSIDGEKYFLLDGRDVADAEVPKGYFFAGDRDIRKGTVSPGFEIFAALTGKHISDWYRDNHFCGRCGEKMTHSETERAMTCKACGYTSYPRIMPAVIVGVTNGDKLLITRYRTGYAHNALIAGFTEIGETVEETVAREVMEEAGIHVKNIRYYKSQPWGVANDILLGFYCDVDGDDTISMDSNELKFAQWLTRDEIELQPDNFSLTNEMMRRFKDGKSI